MRITLRDDRDGHLSRMTPDDQPRPGAWIVTHLYSVRVRHYDWIGTVHDPNCESNGEISLKCVLLCPEFSDEDNLGHPGVPRGGEWCVPGCKGGVGFTGAWWKRRSDKKKSFIYREGGLSPFSSLEFFLFGWKGKKKFFCSDNHDIHTLSSATRQRFRTCRVGPSTSEVPPNCDWFSTVRKPGCYGLEQNSRKYGNHGNQESLRIQLNAANRAKPGGRNETGINVS